MPESGVISSQPAVLLAVIANDRNDDRFALMGRSAWNTGGASTLGGFTLGLFRVGQSDGDSIHDNGTQLKSASSWFMTME